MPGKTGRVGVGCVVGGAITDGKAFHAFSSVIALTNKPLLCASFVLFNDMILILLLIDVDKCFLFETFKNRWF